MADRTVRAIFEASVTKARKGMTDLAGDVDKTGKKVDGLTKDLKALDAQKVKPDVDVQIDEAKKRLSDLTRELGDLKKEPPSPEVDLKIEAAKANIAEVRREIKSLTQQKTEVRIDAGIKDAQKAIASITNELGILRTLETTPEIRADITDAQKRLREARASLRELNGAKANLDVTADTSKAEAAVDGLKGDVAAAGEEGGADAGEGMAKGIIDALGTIPIAGAVVGIGAAIGFALLNGLKDGLQIEASRDLFSARTGLDEDTAARFGRAAGEAYSQNFGESIEGNLDVARRALAGGLIDEKSTDAQIENVIAKLTGLQDLFDYDIPSSVKAVGNALKTGLVKDADQAFDLITASSQKLPTDDLLDTLNEYSNQWVLTGLSGEQAMGLIIQGAQAGARDTDIVADALKELGLRAREGTEPAVLALKDLGLNAKDTVAAFQEGGPRATEALGTVLDALRDARDEGANTQSIITNLFGGPGEDLGAALFALDLDTVADSLGGINGSAGAADKALSTMADNSAAKIETAKRNIETAADGIKGALAEAFSDEIDSAADWVSRNRGPILQFFVDLINAALDGGEAFVEFSATALQAVGGLAEALGKALLVVPGMKDTGLALLGLGVSAQDSADTIRTEVPAALDATRRKINAWAGPEIMKAKVHDATVAMAEDMDKFSALVDASGGTVTINGDKKNADEVLEILTRNIDASDGTVTINGDKVPAADALDRIINSINRGEGEVTIDGDKKPAERKLSTVKGQISAAEASLSIDADTSAADRKLAALKAKYRTLGIRVSGVSSVGGLHEGGIVAGLNGGGKVPGRDPGYDNVLWPLASGGRILRQPLAGGEMVVNSQATTLWEPLLQAINNGLKPGSGGAGYSPTFIAQGLDAQAAIDTAMRRWEYDVVNRL